MGRDITEIKDRLNSVLTKKYNRKDKDKIPQLITGADLAPVEWLSTGLLGYDWVNGGGGPRGKVEQISGRRSSGKTTVALRRIAEAQRLGFVCAFLDVEHELDRSWATKLGVSMDDLILHEPDEEPVEVTLSIVEDLIRDEEIDLLVLDSIPALGTKAMLDGAMGDRHYAGIAGFMENFYKKVIGSGVLYYSDTILIIINQPRENIGNRFVQERLPGGRALQHMSAIITHTMQGDFLTIGSAKKGEEQKIGIEIKLINKKNKVRWPYREQTLRLQFDRGFNPLWDVVQFGEYYGLLDVRGSWYYYEEEQLGQGKNNTMATLASEAELYMKLKKEIVDLIKSGK